MYLLYLDDTGSPGNANEDYFVLGGICVYEAQVDWFSREIDKLAAPYNPTTQKMLNSMHQLSFQEEQIPGSV